MFTVIKCVVGRTILASLDILSPLIEKMTFHLKKFEIRPRNMTVWPKLANIYGSLKIGLFQPSLFSSVIGF